MCWNFLAFDLEIESFDVTKEIEQDEKLSNTLEAFTGRKTKYFTIKD